MGEEIRMWRNQRSEKLRTLCSPKISEWSRPSYKSMKEKVQLWPKSKVGTAIDIFAESQNQTAKPFFLSQVKIDVRPRPSPVIPCAHDALCFYFLVPERDRERRETERGKSSFFLGSIEEREWHNSQHCSIKKTNSQHYSVVITSQNGCNIAQRIRGWFGCNLV